MYLSNSYLMLLGFLKYCYQKIFKLIKSGKNKKVNPKISIVKLDKNSIPLTVIILPIC